MTPNDLKITDPPAKIEGGRGRGEYAQGKGDWRKKKKKKKSPVIFRIPGTGLPVEIFPWIVLRNLRSNVYYAAIVNRHRHFIIF